MMHACLPICFSPVRLFGILWAIACQAPLSVGFPKQEYWSRLPFPPSGDLPNPGIEPSSLISPTIAGEFFITSATWEASDLQVNTCCMKGCHLPFCSSFLAPPSRQVAPCGSMQTSQQKHSQAFCLIIPVSLRELLLL